MKAYEYIISIRDRASSALRNIAQSASVSDERLRGMASRMGTVSSMGSKLIGVLGGIVATLATFQTVKAIFDLGIEAEQTKAKFEVLLGSVQDASKLLGQLNNYANLTPYDNSGVQKNAELLLSFGTAQEDILPTMSMLGDVAMGNQGKLDGLSLAYAQAMSAGRLMGQDLMQMINQGFNPLKVISEQTGLSIGDLKTKMEKGAISSEMLQEAFRVATSEGGQFYKMAEKMGETAGGKLSTMFGMLREQAISLGLKLVELSTPIIDFGIVAVTHIPVVVEHLKSFANWVNENSLIIGLFAIALVALNAQFIISKLSLIAFSIQLKAYILWTKIAAAGQWLWNAALTANPIGLVIAGIAALIAIVILCWNKFEGFRGVIMGIWEVLKLFGEIIKEAVINRFKELLSGITGIGKALLHFFKGEWKEAWEAGKKGVTDLSGVGTASKAFEKAKGIGKAWNTGYQKGVNAEPIKLPKLVGDFQGKEKTIEEASGKKSPHSTVFDELLAPDGKGDGKGKGSKKSNSGIAGITDGGHRQTHITVNLNKLQDKTEIHTINLDEGISDIENKLMELLLRVLNSANQMQTSV